MQTLKVFPERLFVQISPERGLIRVESDGYPVEAGLRVS